MPVLEDLAQNEEFYLSGDGRLPALGGRLDVFTLLKFFYKRNIKLIAPFHREPNPVQGIPIG